jgi:hypothetical protein
MSKKNYTGEEVLAELKQMKQHADQIALSVSALWEFSDRDPDYHPYQLSAEMSAVYHLNKGSIEVLEDLITEVTEEVESDKEVESDD